MSVLEQLRKEAQAIETQRTAQGTVRTIMQQQVLKDLLPFMKRIHDYFKEFQHHLSVVQPEVTVSYEIRGFGPLPELRQGNYALTTDKPEDKPVDMEWVQLRFDCTRDASFEAHTRDAGSAADFKEYLKGNGLRGKQRDAGKGASIFVVEARVPVIMEFRLDLEREAVSLVLRNFSQLGTTRYTLTKDRLDDSMLDGLARMVLRQPNDFDEIMGNKLTETGIFRIREQLQTANVSGEVSVSPPLERPPGLLQRLREAITGR